MKSPLAAFAAGAVFALGLGLSGMTQPDKVVNFLDITGNWDPSLALVMVGAIGVHFFAYRLLPALQKPVLAPAFRVPTRRDITPRLLGGAVLFGSGWALSGYCPGPALVSLGTVNPAPWVFFVGLLVGMLVWRTIELRAARPRTVSTT